MKKRKAYIWLVLWMTVIFLFSSQVGEDSSALSGRLVAVLVWLGIGEGTFLYENLGLFVRKGAHVTEFLVLFLLAVNAFKNDVADRKKLLAAAFLFTVGYAVTDEVHQSFVPGRAGVPTDVLIDSIGPILGVAWLTFRERIGKREYHTT